MSTLADPVELREGAAGLPAPGSTGSTGSVRRRLLPAHWPLTAMLAGYPLWWAMGVANIAWPVLAVPLALQLLRRRRVQVFRGFGLWALFIAWVVITGSRLEKFSHYVAFSWRLSLWISAVLVMIYVRDTPRRKLPDDKVLGMLLVLWGATVVGGYLGLVLGDIRLWTPASMIVPQSLAEIDFINNTVFPRLAQVQDFLGYPLPRPAAPYTFTNEWGASLALLCPVVVVAWPRLRGLRRRAVGILAFASVVPMIVSVNRGLWVTLTVILVYTAARLAQRRDPRAAGRRRPGGAVLVAVIALTPLGSVVSGRLDNDHSNNARLTLYSQVREQVQESPLLGFGSPRSNTDNPLYPPVGTHGTFWLVLFSHGIPGVLFFLAALASLVVRTSRPPDRRMLWLHGIVVGGLVLIPYYDLLPVPIFTLAAVAGVVLRATADHRTATTAAVPA